MKFTCSVDINVAIDDLIPLWEDPENLVHWQDHFLRLEHIHGDPGEPGAQTKFFYKQGKGEMELLETITLKDLPQEMIATYEHKSMTNIMTNRFHILSPGKTRWETEIEYTQFKGLIVNVMAKLFPGMFKKQVQKWLDQFKHFAESKK